jgi:sulfur-oxidizing protein SoxY
MKQAIYQRGMERRGFLRLGAVLAAVAVLPVKVWAAVARKESAFKATGLEQAYAELGVTSPTESDQVVIESPEIAENGAVVPVGVTSKFSNTTRIMIFVEANPNPLSGGFHLPEGTEASVQTRVKMAQTSHVVAVVEADGKFYFSKRETKVTLGGCGG